MDQHRFDDLSRRLGDTISRRGGIAAAVGALLAAGSAGAAARRKPSREGPCGDGSRKDNVCWRNEECCTGVCNRDLGKRNRDGKGRCRCLNRGEACTANRNCCSGLACAGKVCARRCASSSTCTGATPYCCAGACTAGAWTNRGFFGSGPGTEASQLSYPFRFSLTGDRLQAAIADRDNNRISIWTRPSATSTDWRNRTTFGSGPGSNPDQFNAPADATFAPDGLSILVADIYNNRIEQWSRLDNDPEGWICDVTFGSGPGSGDGEFQDPIGVALSPDLLTALVSDNFNNRVQVWTRSAPTAWDWQFVGTFGALGSNPGELHGPQGVVFSPDGLRAIIADIGNNRVSVWSRTSVAAQDWTNLTIVGSGPGSGRNQLTAPEDVSLSADGRMLAVADTGNNRISIWRQGATAADWTNVTTFGSGPGDGPSQFDYPAGVEFGPDGMSAIISDSRNNRMSIWSVECP